MTRRRPIIEHRPADPNLARKRALTSKAVREAVNGVLSNYQGDRRTLGQEFIKAGSALIAGVSDVAGAQSFLGAHAGRISPSLPPAGPRSLADAVFRRRA